MSRDILTCSLGLYNETGFDLIQTWLKENCFCSLNQKYFRNLSPYNNIKSIENSQLQTDEILSAFIRNEFIPLGTIPDISNLIASLDISGSQLEPEDFKQLSKILILSKDLKKYFKKYYFPFWHSFSQNLISSKQVISKIKYIFDDNFEIKFNASSELKGLYESLSKDQENIKNILQRIFNNAKSNNWLGGDQIVIRNDRSVLPIRISQKRKIKGIIQDLSSTGQTAFVEPLEIIEMNNKITDYKFMINKEKRRILLELTAFFIPISNQIQESFNILTFVDRHFTIAKLAHHLNATKPKINSSGLINIKNALNPIFTLANKIPVKLNLKLKDEKILLISGPNAGGKTVVIKSLGLYSLMAQSGLFIPATKAQLPLFTQFMSDIGDGQSIENDLSTFSAHIKNLSSILENADEKSFILLDELGTGTDPIAGSALSQSILECLLEKNSVVIATTHLGSLKVWASKKQGVLNGGMIFDSDALAPTYELLIGYPGASYALEISKQMGLRNDIISRSKEIIGSDNTNLEKILISLEKERLMIESQKLVLHQRTKEISKSEKSIFEKEKEIKQLHKKTKLNANRESEKIILSYRRKIENLITEIRKSQADKKSIQKTKIEINNSLDQLKNEFDDIQKNSQKILKQKFVKGAIVFVPTLNAHGKIISKPDKNNKIRIETNGIKLTLKLSELELTNLNSNNNIEKAVPLIINNAPTLDTIQLDIRGKRVDEAIRLTEKFIDTSIISGVGFINILHGKGTGILMKAIHDCLKNQTCIANYYFADEDKGGPGVTIVEFK